MHIPVLTMKPFVGLKGPDPGSTLVSQKIHTLLVISASAYGVQTKVLPEAVWGDAGTKFPHP